MQAPVRILKTTRSRDISRGGFWLAAMCALLLASSGASASHAALPRLTPQSAQQYAAVLWWLQQQAPADATGVESSLAEVLCHRSDDPIDSVLRLVAELQTRPQSADRETSPLRSKSKAAADEPSSPAIVATFPASRFDTSRRLIARALMPHEALMRSGIAFNSFLE